MGFPEDKRRVRLDLKKVSNLRSFRAVDLVEDDLTLVRFREVVDELVPLRLELLAPVTVLHVKVSYNNFVDVGLSE